MCYGRALFYAGATRLGHRDVGARRQCIGQSFNRLLIDDHFVDYGVFMSSREALRWRVNAHLHLQTPVR